MSDFRRALLDRVEEPLLPPTTASGKVAAEVRIRLALPPGAQAVFSIG